MTHTEHRTTWLKDGAIGLGTGVLFGVSSVAVGHPFDTIKTKMQSELQYLSNDKPGPIQSFIRVIKQQGIRGLYSGCVPPMLGSGLYRATQFGVYESLYTKLQHNNAMLYKLPYTDGIELRVICSGVVASTSRAIIECPIEYIKTNRQVQQSWQYNKIYTGITQQLLRTNIVMVTYFTCMDVAKRKYTQHLKTNTGAFIWSAGSATFGFILAWPFEVLKNQIQANTNIPHSNVNVNANGNITTTYKVSVADRVRYLIQQYGFKGLYRGLFPGVIRSFVSNGTAMVVMKYANKKVTEWGWR